MSEPLQQPARFLCERCGRDVGHDILTCPDRPQGHCPFLVVPTPSRRRYLSLVGIGTAVSFLALLIFWVFRDQLMTQFVSSSAAFLFIGFLSLFFLLIVVAGLANLLSTSSLLYNPSSGLKLKSEAFLGIPRRLTLMSRGEPLALDLPLPQPLFLPPSVTKLSEIAVDSKKWTLAHATDLFRAALVGLLARGLIQTHQYRKYFARGRGELKCSQDLYVFTHTAEERSIASIDGALERRILLVLNSWLMSKRYKQAKWRDEPLIDIPSIFELIYAVYDRDVSSPPQWVFNLVAQDAVARGWGRLEGWPRKRYETSAAYDKRFQSEREILTRLSSTFAQQQPGFSRVLDAQIQKAVRSRKARQYVDPLP